jgi:SOS-response transcriptional repressor LexA
VQHNPAGTGVEADVPSVTVDTPLTSRQRQVYCFLVNHLEEYQYLPTVRNISKALGIKGLQGVVNHLLALQNKGLLRLTCSGAWNRFYLVGLTVRLEPNPTPEGARARRILAGKE